MATPHLQILRPPPEPKPRPVLMNRSFLLLWLAQLISQSAQNAILFTLLVLVTDLTDGSMFTSVLVLAFVVPSVVFGIFSGVLVDMWSKRLLLIYTNVARMLLAICFLLSRDHFGGLIAISIFFATASQFFGTTDAVTVPSVVPKHQLMAANSVFSMAVTGSQLIGMIFLAPILLPTIGATWIFVVGSVMFARPDSRPLAIRLAALSRANRSASWAWWMWSRAGRMARRWWITRKVPRAARATANASPRNRMPCRWRPTR